MQISLNQLIEFEMPSDGLISENAKSKIEYALTYWGFPALPSDWRWDWTLSSKQSKELRTPYVGTLSKRISKYYYNEYDRELNKSQIDAIGVYAKEAENDATKYYFQFVNSFNWDAGAFGDDNSCYFVRSRMPLTVLEQNNILSVCFYREFDKTSQRSGTRPYQIMEYEKRNRKNMDDFNYRIHSEFGLGRAWVRQNFPENGMMTLFNGYGFTGDSLLKISRVLSTYFSTSYKQVIAYNQGRMNGIVYVNVGTRNEVIDGKPVQIKKPRAFILGTNEQLSRYPYETTILELGIKDTSNYYNDEDLEV